MAAALLDRRSDTEGKARRLIAGTAGGVEILMWHYAKGRPLDRVEQGAPGAFAEVTTNELRARLPQALALL